jgi:L-lactate dehydrogenase
VGEHGDSEVAAFSAVRIGGLTLDDFAKHHGPLDTEAAANEVREAAYRILAGKGYTSFGIATAIVRICEAIIRDERIVLPVSTLMTGAFGIEGVYLSLPCILGADGVERVLLPALSPAELDGLRRSAEVIRQAIAQLQA